MIRGEMSNALPKLFVRNLKSNDEEELVDVEDLQSVLTQNEDEEIGSSSKEEQGPLHLLLAKGKKEGFITYAELNEQLPKGIVEADRLEEIVEMINDLGISLFIINPPLVDHNNNLSQISQIVDGLGLYL